MQSKIDIRGVLGSQKSDIAVINVHSENHGGIFQFLKNGAYNHCRIIDLIDTLQATDDLSKVSLLGAMTLLNQAGLSTDMLRAKGAVTNLQDFISLSKRIMENTPEDRDTIRVLQIGLEFFLKQWKTGLLSQSDIELNNALDLSAVEILSSEWYDKICCTDVELVDILHKRVARYVEDEVRNYLGLYDRVDRNDEETSTYAPSIKENILATYRDAKAQKADLNRHIKNLRDLEVLSMYRKGELSVEISKRLDTEIRDRMISAINMNCDKFAADSPALSLWIYNEAHEKHKGKAVDRMSTFNAVVIDELVQNWKKFDINSGLQAEIIAYVMPLVQNLILSAEVETVVINKCADSIMSKPHTLKDAARAQFVETVTSMIKDAVNTLVSKSDNELGKSQVKSFCREVLDHWKVTSTPDSLKKLFNTDIFELIRLLSVYGTRNPSFFNQANAATTVSTANTTAVQSKSSAPAEAEKPGPSK